MKQGYITAGQRAEDDRLLALVWLYLAENNMIENFTAYCKQHNDLTTTDIADRLRKLMEQ